MLNKPLYSPGQLLKQDEFLLKVKSNQVGYITKLTQANKLPVAFSNWNDYQRTRQSQIDDLKIYVHTEKLSAGWKILDTRIGKSQQWAKVVHPEGFIVEIYLHNLITIIKSYTTIAGVIQGEFRWTEHTLVCTDYEGFTTSTVVI